jgi:hypothetical protein
VLTREMRAHIQRVINYLDDERKDYGDDPRQGHVYESVVEIQLWLDSPVGENAPPPDPPPVLNRPLPLPEKRHEKEGA